MVGLPTVRDTQVKPGMYSTGSPPAPEIRCTSSRAAPAAGTLRPRYGQEFDGV